MKKHAIYQGNTLVAVFYGDLLLLEHNWDSLKIIEREAPTPLELEMGLQVGAEVTIESLLYPHFNSIRVADVEFDPFGDDDGAPDQFEVDAGTNLGWERNDFTKEELETVVTIESFDTDLDGFLIVTVSGLTSSKYSREMEAMGEK